MSKGNVTIKDIAKALSISTSTVSRALSGHPDISAETVELVKKTAKKLHYQPNAIAQSLRDHKASTKTIGVVLPEILNYFYASVLNGIEEVAFYKGYQLLLYKSDESHQREVVCLQTLTPKVSGLILCLSQETRKTEHLKPARQKELPIVLVERTLEKMTGSKVLFNDFKIAFALTEHLLRSGFKRPAVVTGPVHLANSAERLRGYREALKKYGAEGNESYVIQGKSGFEPGRAAGARLLDLPVPPDAIFSATDQLSLGVFAELKARNVSIPNQIGLVAFATDPVHNTLEPAVTTIAPIGLDIGNAAARLCIAHMEGKATKTKTEILNADLMIRRSSVRTPYEPHLTQAIPNKHKDAQASLVYIY